MKKIKILSLLACIVFFAACSSDDDNESTEAKITKVNFNNPLILEQPEIGESTDIILYVKEDTNLEELKAVVVTFDVSNNAIVSPESGSKVDLSSGAATFTVTAEDGITKQNYIVKIRSKKIYDFEEWTVINPTSNEEYRYSAPTVGTWASCNNGISTLLVMNTIDKFAVTKTDAAHSGMGAARLETLDTKGSKPFGKIVPKITAGSLYTGIFKLDWNNTLMSTKFGDTFTKKPITLQGYYKYTPGEVFYRSSGVPAEANVAEVEKGTTDQCSINAVLYEYDPQEEEKNSLSTYLTGVDINSSDKIIATAGLKDGSAKGEYTFFSDEFIYTKEYDSKKSYRLAIISSSSAEGDKFSGAPGSVLYMDDITIIY